MTENTASTNRADAGCLSRRGFLAGSAAVGLTIVRPQLVAAAETNAKITLGLIGCGGRGKWIAKLFEKHGGYQFVAATD
jgi:myo-inositol 2-dehydrogenase / D-chiro-inositol 1-dehydrogenase